MAEKVLKTDKEATWKGGLEHGCDVRGHVISALQVNMLCYVWTEEKTRRFLEAEGNS